MKNDLLRQFLALSLLTAFGGSVSGEILTLSMGGASTQPEQFTPGVPLGTAWNISFSFDGASVVKVREIPGYNATFHFTPLSGAASLGGRNTAVDDIWLVTFDNSVGVGGDEIDIHFGKSGKAQLTVALLDMSGSAVNGAGFPQFSGLSLGQFQTRFVNFSTDGQLAAGPSGGSYRQGTVDSFAVSSAVPEPSGITLVGFGLTALVVGRRFQPKSA